MAPPMVEGEERFSKMWGVMLWAWRERAARGPATPEPIMRAVLMGIVVVIKGDEFLYFLWTYMLCWVNVSSGIWRCNVNVASVRNCWESSYPTHVMSAVWAELVFMRL